MNLGDIYRHAAEQPQHLAAVNDGVEYSYRRFAGMIEAVRRHLVMQPIPRGGLVAIMGDSLIHTWVLQLALRSLGFTTVKAASWKVFDSLKLRDVTAVVAFDHSFEGWDHDPAAKRNCLACRVPAGLLAHTDTIPLPTSAGVLPGDHLVFTSGTTGRYKRVLHLSKDFSDRLEYDLDVGHAYRADDVVHLGSLGEWSIAGYVGPQRAWSVGATIIFDRRSNWADYFLDYRVSVVILVGRAIATLCRSRLHHPEDYPVIRMGMGGGFVPNTLLERLLQTFRCRLSNSYNATEFTVALFGIGNSAKDFPWMSPVPGEPLEIIDNDAQPVADGVPGAVRVRLHPWDPVEYFDEPEATARFYRDGYFYPGDLAVRRKDGRIRILGRVDDVLVISGQKVPVRPYEEHAQEVLGVDDVCLFTRQTAAGSVVLLVVIEGAELPAKERLEALSGYYSNDFNEAKFASLSPFPRGANGMGKIDRRAILEMIDQLANDLDQ